jgi:hypothetical protein
MTNLLEQAISTDDGDRAAKIIQDILRHWENSKERARTRNSAVFVGGQRQPSSGLGATALRPIARTFWRPAIVRRARGAHRAEARRRGGDRKNPKAGGG